MSWLNSINLELLYLVFCWLSSPNLLSLVLCPFYVVVYVWVPILYMHALCIPKAKFYKCICYGEAYIYPYIDVSCSIL
jgi:hypothetical protein